MKTAPGWHERKSAFTLSELIVVMAMLALTLSVFTPALSNTKSTGHAIRCLNNTKQLINAWQMYARDNNEKLVGVQQGGGVQGGNYDPKLGPAWAAGWLDWTTSSDNTNIAFLVNERYAKLARYVGQKAFKCPADTTLSSAQKRLGWTQRVRSYSASVFIGPGNAESGPMAAIYRHVVKLSDLQHPAPAETFVQVEEHEDSINDPGFYSPAQTAWIDLPAIRHEGAASFSFADGHAELHHWSGSLTRLKTLGSSWLGVPIPPNDPDLHWVSFHTQRTSINSY